MRRHAHRTVSVTARAAWEATGQPLLVLSIPGSLPPASRLCGCSGLACGQYRRLVGRSSSHSPLLGEKVTCEERS